MSTVQRLTEAVQRRGIAGTARHALSRVTGSAPQRGTAYQEKREAGLHERWQRLDSAIPATCGSLLDIGCNLGDLTALAARRGLVSIGLDIDPRYPVEAVTRHEGVENCGFMVMNLDPVNVTRLPRFDVMLCLSVHHNWVATHGYEAGAEMLRELLRRTESVLIFEGPARRERYYGEYEPSFTDNDETSVTAYYEAMFRNELEGLVDRVEPLGKTANHDPEPYRWAWALYV